MTAQESYDAIKSQMREVWLLSQTNSLLEWDQETYCPPGGIDNRGEQMGLIARLRHERFTDPRLGDWLAACEESDFTKEPDSVESANIRELRRIYDRLTKIPNELVEEEAKLCSKAQHVWAEARKKSDFATFQPYLEKILAITLKKAELFGYSTEPYDALMDDYEPGANAADVEKVFVSLRKDLVELVGKIKDAPRRPDIGIIKQAYEVPRQRLLSELVAQTIGYDFNQGRLDEVTHPFCTGIGPGDTRICTRYYPEDLAEGLTGTVHEAGHAMYDMGLDREQYGMPCGDAISLGLHESQSRMWENQIGRSKPFWNYFFPITQRLFRKQLGEVSLEQFYHVMNYVAPSYIRVEADEATYNLHVMLRFDLERAMVKGEVKVADIPGEWNKRFKEYLGFEVDKDSNGCLQDTHWAIGAIGYFPTYTLGNLYAAQFYAKATEEMPKLDEQFGRGDFSEMLGWLRTNIHRHGARYLAGDLCKKVTGKTLSHKPLIDYLYEKYAPIYGISA